MERSAIVLSTGLLFLAGMAGQSTQSVGMARQVGPDARRLQTGTFMYRDLDHDKDVGKTEIVIRELRGSGNFCFSANITGKFSQNWQSIATSRFEPISAKLSFGEGTSIVPAFDLKYSSGKVAGFAFPRNAPATKRPVDASVPAGTVDQRIDWAAVLASDLETGREFACLDWSERQPHIGGALGAALLKTALKRKWVVQDLDSRTLSVTSLGRREMLIRFGLHL